MKIVQEKNGAELYIDVLLSPQELEHMKNYMMVSKETLIFDKLASIGIKLTLEEEEEECFDF